MPNPRKPPATATAKRPAIPSLQGRSARDVERLVPPRTRRQSALYSIAFLYFETVAQLGSVRRASEALAVSPSAVSHQLGVLEAELGIQLFERLPRGVRITSAGETLLHHVRRASSELERGRSLIESFRGLRRGHVVIATNEGLAISPVSEVLESFWTEWPNVRMSVRIGSEERTVEAVKSGQAEIGLTFTEREIAGVNKLAEIQPHLGAVMSPQHPLAQKKSLRLRDLADTPLLTTGTGVDAPGDIERQFALKTIEPRFRLTTNSMVLQHRIAAMGLGVAVKTRMGGMMAEWAAGKLVFVPISDLEEKAQRVILFVRKDGALSPAGDALAKQFQKSLATMSW